MPGVELIKRWKTSETLLKRAYHALPRSLKPDERFSRIEKEFFNHLEHNKHELALDKLEELAEFVSPHDRFWKDLIRVADNQELLNRVPKYQKKFNPAIPQSKKT